MLTSTRIPVAVILALGLVALGFFIGDGLRHIRSTDRFVNVRGLSERAVTADTAQLMIKVEHNGSTPTAIFPLMTETQNQVLAFLQQAGLKPDEIQIGQWSTTRTSPEDLKNDPSLPRFTSAGAIGVLSHNITAAQDIDRQVNDLRIKTNGGVTDTDVVFSFRGLGPLRAEMIAAATKDARNAALQFAQDSGSQVGSIRNASQGAFQITAPGLDNDDPKSLHKTVRVVTTVDYELKD
jgi:hypothetical protein